MPLMKYLASEDRLVKVYKPEDEGDWSGLVWPGGIKEMPIDHPPCGWQNEFCEQNRLIPVFATICSFIFLASVLLGLAFYVRRKRFVGHIFS